MLFQFAENPEARTKVGTNPAKFAYVRLCSQGREMRLRSTQSPEFSAQFFRVVHARPGMDEDVRGRISRLNRRSLLPFRWPFAELRSFAAKNCRAVENDRERE